MTIAVAVVPGGFAAGPSTIYVSNWSVAPANSGGGATGEVVRITRSAWVG